MASVVADAEDAGAVEDFDRVWARFSVDVSAATAEGVVMTADEGVDASVDADAVNSYIGADSAE